jgi:hypothetical protein
MSRVCRLETDACYDRERVRGLRAARTGHAVAVKGVQTLQLGRGT